MASAVSMLAVSGARAADACSKPDTIPEIIDCAAQRFDTSDKQMNKAYSLLLQHARDTDRSDADAGRVELLRKAQRSWLAFRDAECESQTAVDRHAPVFEANYEDCLRALTDARTVQLHAQAADSN